MTGGYRKSRRPVQTGGVRGTERDGVLKKTGERRLVKG